MNFFFPDNWLAKIATLKKDSQICHNQKYTIYVFEQFVHLSDFF